MAAQRLCLLVTLGVIGCWSLQRLNRWELHPQAQPSSTSRFYILSDWQNTFSDDGTISLPAASVSDVMLKTMGILKEGVKWSGVQMGSLFSRPHATALFVVDGLSQGSLDLSSEKSFPVDQTGLTGSTSEDMRTMFEGDHVAAHMSQLFDGRSQTRSVSANEEAAEASSAEGAFSGSEQVMNVLEMLQKDKSVLEQYGLQTDSLDIQNDDDAAFLTELVMIHQTMEQLKELSSYVDDGAPDVYIFTISTIRALECKYGVESLKVKAATQLVKDTIEKVTRELVALYQGKILVQALVLEWDFVDDGEFPELEIVHDILKPYLISQDFKEFKTSLPHLHLTPEAANDHSLCVNMKRVAEKKSFKVKCPPMPARERYVRQADKSDSVEVSENENNETMSLGNVSEGRSESFTAIFLITLFLGLSLGLSLYAISWMMWTMDPGRDTIIYRQISDPTEGIKL